MKRKRKKSLLSVFGVQLRNMIDDDDKTGSKTIANELLKYNLSIQDLIEEYNNDDLSDLVKDWNVDVTIKVEFKKQIRKQQKPIGMYCIV